MSGERYAPVLPASDPATIRRAAELLRAGGLVVFPTDTVYGIAASVERPDAVARIYVAKARPLDRAIPVLVSDIAQVTRLTRGVTPSISRLLAAYWPGALTVVLPAADWLPVEVTAGAGTVGLRMPDHPTALAIIAGAGGAVATTSANRSGQADARSASEALAALGHAVDLIVDGGPSPGGVPSTVIAIEDGRVRVLRRGAIDPSALPETLD